MALMQTLRLRRAVLAPLLALLLLLLLAASAAPAHAFVRPPPGVNNVYLRMQIISLSDVDGQKQMHTHTHTHAHAHAQWTASLTVVRCSQACSVLVVAAVSCARNERIEALR